MYKCVYSLLLALFALPLFGQNSTMLQFDVLTWDFGSIKEIDGSVFHTFHYINTSSKALNIGYVSPSCDCISAINPPKTIESGEMGELVLRLNPAGYSGPVHRYIDLFLNDGTLLARLNLKADVQAEERSLSEQYPYILTDLVWANAKLINIGYIPLGSSVTRTFSLINTSDKAVNLQIKPRTVPSYITCNHPPIIEPGKTVNIEVCITIPDKPESYGVKNQIIEISIDAKSPPFEFTSSFICIDRLDKSATKKPSLFLSTSLVTLKKALFSSLFEGRVTIENKGNSDLHIRAVETEAEAQINLQQGEVLHPGESKNIKVTSDVNKFSVYLICDDPLRPMKEIRFTTNSL